MPFKITEKCIGCGACARVCPTQAISGEKKAQHVIDGSLCIECGVCGRTCPTAGSILNAKGKECERVKRTEWPKPAVVAKLCSSCQLCVDACPFGCLDITMPKDYPRDIATNAYLKDPKACVACSICVETCPQDAIYLSKEAQ